MKRGKAPCGAENSLNSDYQNPFLYRVWQVSQIKINYTEYEQPHWNYIYLNVYFLLCGTNCNFLANCLNAFADTQIPTKQINKLKHIDIKEIKVRTSSLGNNPLKVSTCFLLYVLQPILSTVSAWKKGTVGPRNIAGEVYFNTD